MSTFILISSEKSHLVESPNEFIYFYFVGKVSLSWKPKRVHLFWFSREGFHLIEWLYLTATILNNVSILSTGDT